MTIYTLLYGDRTSEVGQIRENVGLVNVLDYRGATVFNWYSTTCPNL